VPTAANGKSRVLQNNRVRIQHNREKSVSRVMGLEILG
jgi:hypothetical protein